MKKLPIFLAVSVFFGIASAYAVKSDIHKKILGENSLVVHFIEEILGHNPPSFDGNIEGKTAPDFSLTKLGGGTMNLADYKGKLVVLNFWASWCGPCRAEMPGFVKVQEEYKEKGVSFLGVAIEDKEQVEAFLKEVPINYPTSYGVEDAYDVSTAYGNPDGALPYTLIITPDQKIIKSYNGLVNEEVLKAVIKENLPKQT